MSSILRRFASEYVRPHIFSFSLASLFLLATNYLTVSIPEQIGSAIDNFDKDALTPILNIIWIIAPDYYMMMMLCYLHT